MFSRLSLMRQAASRGMQKTLKRRMGGLHTFPERIQSLEPGVTEAWKRATIPPHERAFMLGMIVISLMGPYWGFILLTDPNWGPLPFKDNPEGWKGNHILEDPGVTDE